MKHIIILLFCFFTWTINAQDYHINGKVIGIKDSTMILIRNVERDLPFDTTYVVNSKFSFNGLVDDDSEMFFIRTTPYEKTLTKRFFIENTNIDVVLIASEEPHVMVSGGILQNQSNSYESFISNPIKERKIIEEKMRNEKDTDKQSELMEIRSSLYYSIKDLQIDYIKSHLDEDYTAYLINELRINLKNEEVKDFYNVLDAKVKESKYGKIISNYLKKSIDFTKGTPIVDFTLKDLKGENVSLSSFKGKYVLLDFWGSWCGICRGKYPEYSKIYEKYRDKGFEIVGVSLDKDEHKWKRAVKNDNLHWTNLIDSTGFLGDIAVTYKVWTVPIAYFIDPEGNIIEPITFNSFTEEKLVRALNKE
ncbi:TlpA disulfide reductase family protein [Confluentibacter sediminis]|uniref:TlpA disulfide reductase family protein n=1 Tax=Confluentibacter sediminis TaxID=2219045 RepID=UPI000DAEE5D7|nr:TlpA disulfide reductase family protein [Confluentibacter sediminis]